MSDISFVQPRDTVEVHLPDGRVLQGKRSTKIETFLKTLPEWENPQVVAAIINGSLRELTYPIKMDADVKLVTEQEADGARIYRRSLTFLLKAAFDQLFPDATFNHRSCS